MRVLIACEYSGRVRDAFRARAGMRLLAAIFYPRKRRGPTYRKMF
jgi:hypothetical protein